MLIWYFHFHFVSNSTVNLSLLFIYETFDGNKSRDLDKYERLARAVTSDERVRELMISFQTE